MRGAPALLALLALACGGAADTLPPPRRPLAATPDADFRHRPPVIPLDAVTRGALAPDTRVLPNGMTVLRVEGTDPNVVLAFMTRGNHEDLPVTQAGLSMITGEATLRSTVLPDGRVIDRLLERSGFRPLVLTTEEGTGVALRVDPERWTEALRAIALTVRRPAFVPRTVADLLVAADQRLDRSFRSAMEASALLGRVRIFPPGERWGVALLGVPDVLRSFTPDMLRAHWASTHRPQQSVLVAVGDLNPAALEASVDEAFGTWVAPPPAPHPARSIPREAVRPPQLAVVLAAVEEPFVLYMSRAPPRADRHHAAFEVLTRILGGMFVSRLSLELRETEGYTYGVHAGYEAHRDHGLFRLQTSIRPDRVATALQAFVTEVNRLREQGPGEEELAIARTLAVEAAYGRREGNVTTALHLAEAYAQGVSLEALQGEPEAMAAVDGEAVRAAAEEWLRPSQASLVVAGRQRDVVPRLQAAGYREYSLHSLE